MSAVKLKELDVNEMGRRVRLQRDALGLSREKLAEITELSSQFISDIEYGHKRMSVTTLYKVCQALDVSADYLLAGRGEESDDGASRVREEINSRLLHCNKDQLDGISEIARIYERATRNRSN